MRRTLLVLCALGCGPGDRSSPSTDGGPGDRADAGEWQGGDGGDCAEVIDVVLVLDVSSSMNFVLDDLQNDIAGVVEAANALAPDSHFGLVSFSDNYLLDTSGDLEGGRVHTEAASLEDAFAEVQSTYTMWDRNPGDGPGGPIFQNPVCEENALDALYVAASEFPWREEATRVVVVATDDTFLERPDNYGDGDGDGDTTGFGEGDYPAEWTVAETVGVLTGSGARVFSFTRLDPPPAGERCSTGRRYQWQDITDGWTTPYQGAEPIPDQTDGRNYDLARVQSGQLSLADTISEVVVESHCNPVE
jgi:hypothetical protein